VSWVSDGVHATLIRGNSVPEKGRSELGSGGHGQKRITFAVCSPLVNLAYNPDQAVELRMIPATYLTFPELFDRRATMEGLVELVKGVPLHHAAFVLSYLNLALRYAVQEMDRKNLADVQRHLVRNHFDAETLALLDQRFKKVNCVDRPIFFAQSILAVLRLITLHCDPEPLPDLSDDERVRTTIGRACLMMNQLLITAEEERALNAGTDDDKRIELMVQSLAGFELMNPRDDRHLMRRLCVLIDDKGHCLPPAAWLKYSTGQNLDGGSLLGSVTYAFSFLHL
jgi:hypothetical protein